MRLPHAVRMLGHRVLGPVPVRIRSGVNRGRRWSLASLGRGFGSGGFEADRMAALAALVSEGECFWDIGAHRGFVSLAASGWVGRSGTVVAVEPSSGNRRFLARHLRWNGIENVRVVPAAASDEPGEAAFGGVGSSVAFRLGEGTETVPVTTLEAIVSEWDAPPPTFMKIDVEGSEGAALRGGSGLLGPALALLVSVHGRDLYAECRRMLELRGFRLYESVELSRRTADLDAPWIGDVDFLALGPARGLEEGVLNRLRLFRS